MGFVINLNTLGGDKVEFNFHFGRELFEQFSQAIVEEGKIDACITLQRLREDEFSLSLSLKGEVEVPCDYCLQPMQLPIDVEESMTVGYGDPGDTTPERIVVSGDGKLDAAQLAYDYIILSIPMRNTHPEGECDRLMEEKLRKVLVTELGDNEETQDN